MPADRAVTEFLHAWRDGDDAAIDALALPSYFHYHGVLAMAAGQLGERALARRALEELAVQKPDMAETARDEWSKWLGSDELLEHALEGLRKAGLHVP